MKKIHVGIASLGGGVYTAGHDAYVKHVERAAHKDKAHHVIYVGKEHDGATAGAKSVVGKKWGPNTKDPALKGKPKIPRSPLSLHDKMHYAKQLNPHINFKPMTHNSFEHLNDLHHRGYGEIHVHVDHKEKPMWDRQFDSARKTGELQANVHTHGIRRVKNASGHAISGTMVRDFVHKGDYTSFEKNLPTQHKEHPGYAKRLFNHVRREMGQKEIKEARDNKWRDILYYLNK